MRLDTILYYHVGEPCDRGRLFDEMHETIERVDALGYTRVWLAVQVERLREGLGCRHLALFLNIPLLSFAQVKRGPRRFAEEVMPRFTAPAPGRRPGSSLAPAEMRA